MIYDHPNNLTKDDMKAVFLEEALLSEADFLWRLREVAIKAIEEIGIFEEGEGLFPEEISPKTKLLWEYLKKLHNDLKVLTRKMEG